MIDRTEMQTSDPVGPTDRVVFLRPIDWKDIFDGWRKDESGQESWKRHWASQGFWSWDEWRSHHLRPYRMETLEWSLFGIPDPLATVPDFFGVSSRNWIEGAYGGDTTRRIREIVHLPIVTDNEKISDVRESFPKRTVLVGIRAGFRIILIEGMHRSCAIATWDPSVPFRSEMTIALAKWPETEFALAKERPNGQ